MSYKHARRYQKTPWGIKIINFKERYGMTLKELSTRAGVKVSVLRQVMIGKTPGYEIVGKVDSFISDYEARHEAKPLLTTF